MSETSAPTAADLVKAALKLPEADRLEIARQLEQSVVPPGIMVEGEPGYFEELDRRLADLKSGKDPGIDAFEALDQIERDLDARQNG